MFQYTYIAHLVGDISTNSLFYVQTGVCKMVPSLPPCGVINVSRGIFVSQFHPVSQERFWMTSLILNTDMSKLMTAYASIAAGGLYGM